MFHRVTVALVITFVVGCVYGHAQADGSRQGFWLSAGGGGGWNDGTGGASGYIRAGGTPNEHVQFGVQVLRWWRVENREVYGRTSVAATAQLFPLTSSARGSSPLNHWHLRAGFGIASVDHFMSGMAINLGTGIDLGMDGRFFVTPGVDVLVQMYRHLTNTAVLFTMGLTWH
ncbi:hypothetical protein ACFL3B_01215 [Gemmatimonadota bacterium]